jgi:threonyl-tRNA synthetase
MITITLPDGTAKEFASGTTGHDVALSISEGLARNALAIKANDTLIDIHAPLTTDTSIKIITFNDDEGKHMFWHSSAHLLAHAIKRLYPEALPTIGPALEEGFYYDFDNLNISSDDFPAIEAEMKKIVKEKIETKRIDYTSKEEALKQFAHNKYKVEMINNLEEGLSAYEQGDFVDLCRGPHIPNTKMIKALKLTKISGAYWRADANNAQLTRIYGISFPDKKDLKAYLEFIEEAKKRDHRRIGKTLDLFSFNDLSPGSPFFHPKGAFMYNTLMQFMREEYHKREYAEVITPLIYDKELWETSGHWQHYQENMFVLSMDHKEASLKPMNCPSHCMIYKTSSKSYRDLPLRIADFAPLHRNELKGALGGLMRVRKFCQDDAHIFCREDQIEQEIIAVMDFVKFVYTDVFNMPFHLELSTKPEKALGSDQQWEIAENGLAKALKKMDMEYQLNPGDGAFYGPKIDIHVQDSLRRTHQVATIQLDFQLPQQFGLEYAGEDGNRHTPVMVHRAVLGSVERFLGILIEHYAGKFPLWISPNQIIILPIADRHNDYVENIAKEMKAAGLRVDIDERSESTKKKVRDAQLQQYNYILIVGDSEVEHNSVNVRTRDEVVHGETKVDEFISQRQEEIKERK